MLIRASRAAVLLLTASLTLAHADEPRYVDEATLGMELPGASLAGEHDALAVSANPAGLPWLGGWHAGLVFTGLDEDEAQAAGSGVGGFLAVPFRWPFLPRLALGLGAEQLLPPRVSLAPDPGEALRLSFAMAAQLSPWLSFGAAWRHFVDDDGGALAGVDSLDLGLSARLGSHVAFGLVLHGLNTPVVNGLAVQRRYQAELVGRPLGSDRLEIGLGGTLGERRLDVDADLRLGVRIIDGLWLRADAALLRRHELVDPRFDAGGADDKYGWRASFGLEVSFGAWGLSAYGTGGGGAGRGSHLLGASTGLRFSAERLPAIIGGGPYMAMVELTGELGGPGLTGQLLDLRRYQRDDDCRAVLIKIDSLRVGWAGAQELRQAIARLRQAGKKVVAMVTTGGTRDYYVAAAADQILLDASGGLRLQGLLGMVLYYKGLLDRLGVNAQFEKIEEFKSAPEAFTREGPSDEAKMVRDALFDDTYRQFLTDVAADRKSTPAAYQALVDNGPYTAEEAGAARLVDAVVEAPEAEIAVAQALGGRLWPVGAGVPPARDPRWGYPKVAVIYIDGDIIDGKSRNVPILGQRMVGGDTIAAAISQARFDPTVVAVVLRIDSPGGSALASEVMAREVLETRGVKPIIVSMGDVAASGGYFAAAYGDLVYAMPGTITGSIGIFTGKVDVSGLLAKLGVGIDLTKRGAHADQESFYRPYTDEERAAIKNKLRYYYGRFVKAVARGRNMKFEEVDAVARGRVWTGAQAMDKKLVDRMGGVVDAVVEAKKRAGLGDDDVVHVISLPEAPAGLVEQVLGLFGGSSAMETTGLAELPILADLLRILPGSLLFGADGRPQARLDFAIIE